MSAPRGPGVGAAGGAGQQERRETGPVAFLMSDYDGFIGWMVLAWTFVIGWVLWWYYRSRSGTSSSNT